MADSKNEPLPQDPSHLVETNYDLIASNYLTWILSQESPTPRLSYLSKFLSHIPHHSSASVLEIGCGAGVPGTQELARQCGRVVANDISQAQLALARTHVTAQNVEFVHGDVRKLVFPPASFDGVLGFYSILHLPRDDQRGLFKLITEWLRPGGWVLCNLGTLDEAGAVGEWLGGTMFWSGWDPAENEKMVRDAGLEVLESEIVEEEEDGRVVPFQWILAKKG